MAIGAHLGAKMGQDGAKLANLAPRCAQDGQLGSQDGQLGALLGASWRPVLDLGRDLAKNGENQKNDESTALLKVFWGPGAPLGGYVGLSWLILALCWAVLGHLGAILEQLGDKMGPKSAKMNQESAQDRQHEPT